MCPALEYTTSPVTVLRMPKKRVTNIMDSLSSAAANNRVNRTANKLRLLDLSALLALRRLVSWRVGR